MFLSRGRAFVGHFFKKYLIVKNLAFKRGFHLRLHLVLPLLLLLAVDIVAPNAIEAKARGAPVFVAALRFPVVWTREPQLLENWIVRAGGDITGEELGKIGGNWEEIWKLGE